LKKKTLAVTILAVFVTAFFIICLSDSGTLAFFSIVFGGKVYVVTVSYQPAPTYYRSEIVGVTFSWAFSSDTVQMAIDRILIGYDVKTVGEPAFSLENHSFALQITVQVWAANQINLFSNTFQFSDSNPRQIIVYLPNYKNDYGQVHVEITGHYAFGNSGADFAAGETLEA
jgi:hypothetical protein